MLMKFADDTNLRDNMNIEEDQNKVEEDYMTLRNEKTDES